MTKFGISVALLTPFYEDGSLDVETLANHAAGLLDAGVNGITLFGTTGEGASIGAKERFTGLEALLAKGIPANRITYGLSSTAIADASDQVDRARAMGVQSFLALPHFYFKGCADAGLLNWHLQLLANTPADTEIILYHIPQVTGVPLSLDLIGQLKTAAPERIRAIKDSSGDWDNTSALLHSGILPVLVGDERLLHKAAALGGDGSICGFSNLYPERLVKLFNTATEDVALSEEVTKVVSLPVIPALKSMMAAQSGHRGWTHIRSPLEPLGTDAEQSLLAAIEGGG